VRCRGFCGHSDCLGDREEIISLLSGLGGAKPSQKSMSKMKSKIEKRMRSKRKRRSRT
jgi:hypothetical protein